MKRLVRHLATLAGAQLRLTLSRAAVVFFLLPLLFTLVLGKVFASSSAPRTSPTLELRVLAESTPAWLSTTKTAPLIVAFETPRSEPPPRRGAVLDLAKEPGRLRVSPESRGLEMPLRQLLEIWRAQGRTPGSSLTIVAAEPKAEGPERRWDGTLRIAPGMLLMFASFLLWTGGISLLEDRATGILDRLIANGVEPSVLLAGRLLGVVAAALLQMTVLLVAGRVFFGVPWGQYPLALLALLVSFAAAGAGLGLAVASYARNPSQAETAAVLGIMGLCALGGAWWPLEDVGTLARQVAPLSPAYWGMAGLKSLLLGEFDGRALVTQCLVLLGFAAAGTAVGTRRLELGRYRQS